MAKSKIEDIKSQDVKTLSAQKTKKQFELVNAKANLAQAGKKNSNETKKLKKDIARIETVIAEKLYNEIA